VHRSTAFVRRACAVGTATALVGLTTGFGVMTATASYADTGSTAETGVSTSAVPGSDATAPVTTGLPTDAGSPAPAAATPAPSAAPAAGVPSSGSPAAPATAAPAASQPAVAKAAAVPPISITGQAKIGSQLTAVSEGGVTFAWTIDGAVVATQTVYTPTDVALIGKTVVLTVTDDATGQTNTASTAAILPNPTFADATTADAPLALSGTAGEAFSHTFAVTGTKSGDVSYAVAWSDPDQADPEDPTWTPESQLPEGITLDAATGVLSGTTESAEDDVFAITATSQGVSTTQYVELTVEAAAASGVQVFALDRADYAKYAQGDATGSFTSWIIDADGSVSTDVTTVTSDDEGVTFGDVVTPGGTVTVGQGGTLVVNGNVVDRFGNPVTDADGTGAPISVRSDVASDVVVVEPDEDDFSAGSVDVTFPHASTHRLTVAAADVATAFDVTVVPTAATAPTAVTPVATPAAQPIGTRQAPAVARVTAHRLAYTGTETTGVLPWALGMLAAGAALVGLRTARRRRAQR
jgi:hypothetical protein